MAKITFNEAISAKRSLEYRIKEDYQYNPKGATVNGFGQSNLGSLAGFNDERKAIKAAYSNMLERLNQATFEI